MAIPKSANRSWDEQTHADFSGLQERVTGLETGFSELKRDTAAGFSSLAAKLDALNAARNTSIGSFLGTSASVGGVAIVIIGGFFWAVIGPMGETQRELVSDLKALARDSVSLDTFKSDKAGQDGWIANIRDRIRVDEDNAVTQKQIAELKDRIDERYKITEASTHDEIGKLEARMAAIDAQLIKRPEIETMITGLNERINTIGNGLHEVQHDTSQGYTMGDRLKSLEAELAEARKQTSTNAAQGK